MPDQPASSTLIDRRAVVARHGICETGNTALPLALGNGKFCFGADATGLQTFAGNCMAHWAWHSFPLPSGRTPKDIPATGTFQQGRCTGADHSLEDAEDIRRWMYDNPHKINLGRIRLQRTACADLTEADITGLTRQLDLWTGMHTSEFRIDGKPVRVQTCVHPDIDLVAVMIESTLLNQGALEVMLDLPYPALDNNAWVGDFSKPCNDQDNQVEFRQADACRLHIRRTLDATVYHAALQCSTGGRAEPRGHRVRLIPQGVDTLELSLAFAPDAFDTALPGFADTRTAAARHWEKFWLSGGAIDLSASRDPRWRELERRVVLSQYQMAAQSAGPWPSAEAGLMGLDPWRGQFHMEMTWWHLAHYALWNRWALAMPALDCFRRFMPAARELAGQLGYKGLKWPKSVGPEGRSAPWEGNQVLLWKQPHPIFFAELAYRRDPTRATLDKWADIVQGTAEHMADYPVKAEATGRYSLSPVMPPSELGITRDTVFDLAYWRWGLDTAQEWRRRLGLPRDPDWDEVRNHLAPLPTANGVFVHSAEWSDTYTQRNWEHPDPVGVLGMLPPIDGVDPATARRTVAKVWETWDWSRCWGWDFPWIAMAAARTGQPEIAVEALLKNSPKNQYPINGLNNGGYLPGNGGLLYAVAMMAAGWTGAPDHHPAPGFPNNETWVVRSEGLTQAL